MDQIVESLKRLYKDHKITDETLNMLVKNKSILEKDREYIKGKEE